ncbi:hypothetical protein RF11_09543 [Thelohanellus kitauei]|uniref:Uncharacterized protein n=1 Tax=Thelohanellus kitauei TaxID=669202 RepID=A0A0C2JHB5_THEKT|nr:hypothetical protein RF11_09543 [Thelohanellus kitauei]
MKMVEPNSVLRSLRPQERAQQSSKDRNQTGFKSEHGKKPKAFQKDTSGCSGIWDISKAYIDLGSSGKLLTNSKPSTTKLGSTLSPKSDVQKLGTSKIRASPRIEQNVKTSGKSLPIKKRTRVLPEVEFSDSEDLLVGAAPKGGSHSIQTPMFQKNIKSKTNDKDSSNDFVKDKEPNIKTVKASGLDKTVERGLVNKKLQTGHASEAQITKYTGSSLASKKGARIAVESSKTVNSRSRKADVCESKSHVSTRNPKPNDKKKVPTKVAGSKTQLISKSSFAPGKTENESKKLKVEKTRSGSNAPTSLLKYFDHNKNGNVADTNKKSQGNSTMSQNEFIFCKSVKELLRQIRNDPSHVETYLKRYSISIGPYSQSGANSLNRGFGEADKNFDVKSKKLKHSEKDRKEGSPTLQVLIENIKRPASKDVSNKIPCSLSQDSNDTQKGDEPSRNLKSSVKISSKDKTTESKNDFKKVNEDFLTNNGCTTSALGEIITHTKAANVSNVQDFKQTNKSCLKRMENTKRQLSEDPRTAESEHTASISSKVTTSQDFDNVRIKDNTEKTIKTKQESSRSL